MKVSVHSSSEVLSSNIGEGTTIWQNCVILENAVIGKNCNINFNVYIENDVIIGDHVTIKPGVQVWDGLRIGNYVFIGPNVTFTNDLVPKSKANNFRLLYSDIKNNVTIGANSTIIAGIIIEEFAFIGAGSVVTKNIPPFTVWYGNPATHKGFITKDGVILNLNFTDKKGNKYAIVNNELINLNI